MCKTNIFYVTKSKIEGKGLFTKVALEAGTCAGLLAKVHGVNNFNDKPHGIFINHSNDYNLDFDVRFLLIFLGCLLFICLSKLGL